MPLNNQQRMPTNKDSCSIIKIGKKFLFKLLKRLGENKAPPKIWDRSVMIIPEMVGYTIMVHNGRKHVPLLIAIEMIGRKIGEYVPTKVVPVHSVKKADSGGNKNKKK